MNEDLLEISDGKLYSINDMPRVGCHDCVGCSTCCCGMGDSILLDPYDVDQLSKGLGMSLDQLLQGPVELHMEDGLLLPNLKMNDRDCCSFLNPEGRCSIHSFRPGLCRLFPLGRNYETDEESGSMTLNYFLLLHECPASNRTKVKIAKWLGVGQIRDYQRFLIRWHQLTKRLRAEITAQPGEEENRKAILRFLQLFYGKPYTEGNFYREFHERADLFD